MIAVPELVTIDPEVTAAVHAVIPLSGLRDFFDASFGALAGAIAAQQLDIKSPAFGLYRGASGDPLDVEVGFATGRPVDPTGAVFAGSLPGGRVARLTHVGGFDGLGSSWNDLHAWIESQGLTPADHRWEVYITQPSPDMDPNDLRTELNWPVAD
ncbi:AraC family transcriptional regulator [Nocardia sp. SYP-A9097]|uniref:GyrI-like domain-containing protein n=1 Tax=Nocardia sp. SYP-A9097 TaxID=2663237 RepID=UPI00129A2275|nr:GyrI-like domain-containing protein [Nocardia sp. SYP-A9097]MRH93553.1 AraC family transcriptional regulator [Nocardia sp. SYP-A9097]